MEFISESEMQYLWGSEFQNPKNRTEKRRAKNFMAKLAERCMKHPDFQEELKKQLEESGVKCPI